jgi:hypothetical protein
MTGKSFSGEPMVPLLCAALISAFVIGIGAALTVAPEDGTADLVTRLFINPMCRGILGVAFAVILFGLLELRGAKMDAAGRLFPLAWASGRREGEITTAAWQAQNERRLSPMTYAIFALPLLGFIGTVVGISGAIGDLGGMFEAQDRGKALAAVLGELRFAFDTTFAGLIGVLPVAFILLAVRNAASRLEVNLAEAS